MSNRLSEQTCKPCKGNVPPLKGDALAPLFKQLQEGWELVKEHHLQKMYTFDDFRQALDFTCRVGELAEEEGHHPDINLTYGKVELKIWTHKIDGLTESDFIFADKADAVLQR